MSINLDKINQQFKSGAFWVSIIVLISIPLTYLRTYLLSNLDSSGNLLGLYSLMLVFAEVVITFTLLGGSSAITKYVAKAYEKDGVPSFIVSYLLTSLPLVFIFFIVVSITASFFSNELYLLYSANKLLLFLLAALMFFSQFFIYTLSGVGRYKEMSILLQLQLVVIVLFLTAAYFFTEVKDILIEDPGRAFIFLLISIHIAIIFISLFRIIGYIAPAKIYPLSFPNGFYRFSLYVYGNSIIRFCYGNLDKIFVASYLSLASLGFYYLILQFSELVRFIPNKLSQVFLGTFSNYISTQDELVVSEKYGSVSRYVILICSLISIPLVLFSSEILSYFGDWVESPEYFVYLVLTMNFACLGNLNSMVVLAFDKAKLFLLNNLSVILVQLPIMFIGLESMGILAAILGKIAGLIVGQIGLMLIVYGAQRKHKLIFPKYFVLSQILLLVCFFINHNVEAPFIKVFIVIGACTLSFLFSGFNIRELLFNLKGSKNAK
ncbi:oligosaccharide flippase family protein [Pseudoalteromonas sp. EB27]|uniref:lipopolysaccharide biosynthesis protein n=1 Tax=Pseudoalteromonas sp. EB27 TaxID=1938368 RepID=UPI000978727D|nr:oligosaccharide flippase family protein [Pseudoalteromonas sp. EB27]